MSNWKNNYVKLHYCPTDKLPLRHPIKLSNNVFNFLHSIMLTRINDISLRASYAAMAFLSVPKAGAQIFGEVPDIGGVDGSDTDSIRSGILRVLEIILSFMALIAVVFIVIAGIQLVISQGEEQAKDKAKKTIVYAVIGLVVILLAQAIVGFVESVGQDL